MSFWRDQFPPHQSHADVRVVENICREYFNFEKVKKNKTFKPSRGGSYGAKLEEHKKGKIKEKKRSEG